MVIADAATARPSSFACPSLALEQLSHGWVCRSTPNRPATELAAAGALRSSVAHTSCRSRGLSSRDRMLPISRQDGYHSDMNEAQTHRLFSALGEQLAARGEHVELVVIGGSGLLALGLISRATRDVDVVALLSGRALANPRPLPSGLIEASDQVARDFGLPEDWLNAAPADLLDFGLPDGFVDRLERREYGKALTVHLASRFDQIHFKLYATVDQGPGKHEADLRALEPTRDELLAAARWTRTHDPSEGFREQLVAVLAYFGVEDVRLDA